MTFGRDLPPAYRLARWALLIDPTAQFPSNNLGTLSFDLTNKTADVQFLVFAVKQRS